MAARRPKPRRHPHDSDRFTAPLKLRRELLEAIIAYAIFMSKRRRRRAGVKVADIEDVAHREQIWFQARRAKVLERYHAHLAYLEEEHPITFRTLSRHLNACKRDGLLKIEQHWRYDKRIGASIPLSNIYIVTRDGILWMKNRADSIRVPKVV